MQLSKLLEGIPTQDVIYGDLEISALCTDSKKMQPNGLFFCLKGEKVDGHTYVAEAVKNGAVALVCENRLPIAIPQIVVASSRAALAKISANFYQNPTHDLKIIGVTGTNGKTTTAHMLASILEEEGKKTAVIGTLGTLFNGVYEQTDLTTPDPMDLQRTFRRLCNHGVEYVVMEVSAHALYYEKTAGIPYAACIFTNLSQDHLDFFKTMSAYKEAKERLFLSAECPISILNGDEETGREIGQMLELKKKNSFIYYGMKTPTDAFALVTKEDLDGTECMLNMEDKLCRVSLSMTGIHNVYNALAAATCAFRLGVSLSSIARGLQNLKRVRGRLEKIANIGDAYVYVDFAHTPDGLEKSLETLKKHCKGRLICLFGCGGNRDRLKRPKMGECAAKLADFTVLTSDNPRYEDPLDILSDIEKGYRRYSVKYVLIPNREKAIEYALEILKRDDVLLIAGKGAEDSQEIMGIKYPFNDQDIVEKIIKKKGKPWLS